ncbi:MFS transporter [Paeniglutamicibacter sp. NPDC012692]|uniref:MFS transporter n=1 Tax=Paeniglutamicibacter sp. NPDC012692 TaxID=3364388 RepID=UPI0036C633F9
MTTSSKSVLKPVSTRARAQRRVVLTLSASQLLSGVGNGAGLAIGSLMAVELTGSNAFAGASTTAISVAGAVSALPLAALAVKRGRRVALSLGYFLAGIGAVLMMLAPVTRSFAVLLIGAALLGVGSAANLQARFAATDLADDATRGRDLGLVVWSITVGAVAGPNLIGPGSALGASLGLPPMSGPFLFSLAGMVLAIVILNIGLRPDPIMLARGFDEAAGHPGAKPAVGRGRGSLATGLSAARQSPGAMLGISTIVVAHLVMVGIMSMTPVHLKDMAATPGHAMHHGAGDILVVIGFTISLHIAGMYALSPLVGALADRMGRIRMMLASQGMLVAAVLVCGLGADSQAAVTTGLVLLGLGWSMATVSGSAFLAERVARERRVLVQGVSDTLMGAAGALGAAGSGLLLAWLGFAGLGYLCLVFILAVTPFCLRELARQRKS